MNHPTIQNANDFWKEVHKTDDCWFFVHNRQIKYKGHLITPYRLAWEFTHGKLPSKFALVLHSCKCNGCVNPKHLYLGSQKDIDVRNNNPDKFWKRVDKKNGPIIYKKLGRCWMWTGGMYNHGGHGQVQYQKKHYPAQRLSWLLTFGSLPENLLVCHKCDNPPCVRPSHLFLGTPKDNTDDMVAKGRHRSGGRYERTPEWRAAMSKRMKGTKFNLGRKLSEETKKKIGDANRGRIQSAETREKKRLASLGNTHVHDAWLRKQKQKKP